MLFYLFLYPEWYDGGQGSGGPEQGVGAGRRDRREKGRMWEFSKGGKNKK